MISVVTVSYQEGQKVGELIGNVDSFADEIIIFNIEKDFNTIVFNNKKVRVINHDFVPFVEKVRDLSISKALGDWILVLDPDERVGDRLLAELKEVSRQDEYVAVNIPRKNIFFGKWIKHSNFWPDRHLRFFRKNSLKWPEVIHSYPEVKGRIKVLAAKENLAIEHYGYDNYHQFLERQERYAQVEAESRLKRGERFSILQLIWRPMRELLVRFIKHQGYLDGFDGLFLTLALMEYQIKVQMKMLKNGA